VVRGAILLTYPYFLPLVPPLVMIEAGSIPHASTESPRKPSLKAPCLRGLGEVGGLIHQPINPNHLTTRTGDPRQTKGGMKR